ncbi:PadR family transcriptional regulator [Fictibacillus barbaricus]|uniref:PadR family transcriptional regulator n=1 Tax=Fictibacillus barbaricus TaxID=182136 RepID=A0ABS2ZJY5_9BACL|nr:PadR family transcriptional regulator [Fictibacillus barbaricus]MBN3547757.1 PadR family transcriptional regulator [Fictibacillus barbaricus]GGB51318.1 negative transcription regulator PadR [Fictibacillus barbaricus]
MALRYALLGLLAKNEATGYELTQQFKETVIHFWTAHHTQIYRELLKMEEEGLTHSKTVQQSDYPDKKIYTITDKGFEKLLEWMLNKPVSVPKLKDDLLLRVSMFHFIPAEKAIAFLEKSKEHHQMGLMMTKKWQDEHFPEGRYGQNELGEYLTSEYGIRYMESWLSWCNWAIKVLKKKGVS